MTSITPTPEVQSERDNKARRSGRGRLWALLVVLLLAGVVILLGWLFPLTTATQTESFEGSVDQVVIDVTGQVSLTAGDRTELTITKEALFSSVPVVEVTHQGGVARVNGDCPWFGIRCTMSVSGTVASDAEVHVITSAGSIEVVGTRNGVDLETSAGSIHAVDVLGAARLITSAGSITGSISDGDVDAETSLGMIQLSVLGEFSLLSATTSAGSIDLLVTDEAYNVETDTSAGSVQIGVKTDPSASRRIIAETSAGSITISPAH